MSSSKTKQSTPQNATQTGGDGGTTPTLKLTKAQRDRARRERNRSHASTTTREQITNRLGKAVSAGIEAYETLSGNARVQWCETMASLNGFNLVPKAQLAQPANVGNLPGHLIGQTGPEGSYSPIETQQATAAGVGR